MAEELEFETYLYLSKDKFKIFVFDKKKLTNLFNEELTVYNKFNFQDLNNLSKFLDENIYKIEKLVNNFIKNIILIIDNNKNLQVNISVKKKNYEAPMNQKYLASSLTEIKDLFKENYQDQTIMHMVVLNYIINGKNYSSFVADLDADHLCLEVNFISISNDLVFLFDKLLGKYQISVSQYLCGNYIKNFFRDDKTEFSKKAYRLKNGINDNEVILVPKNVENKGFFEKFFQLFS